MSVLIHPTAVVEPGAELGIDVSVGPYTVIGPDVRVGDRTRIGAQVVLDGADRAAHGFGARSDRLQPQGEHDGAWGEDHAVHPRDPTRRPPAGRSPAPRVGSGAMSAVRNLRFRSSRVTW